MKKALMLCALLAPVSGYAQDTSLSLFTESYAPYSYLEGDTLTGHAVDFMTEALSRSGVAASMELTKWSRAISLAEKQPDTCVFPTARTEEREPKFQWVGPMYSNGEYLLQRTGTNQDVTTLEEALTKTIGTQFGDYTEGMLKGMGATKIDLAADQQMTFKKLAAGRLDYVIVLGGAAEAAIANGDFEIAMEVSRTDIYLACSNDTSVEAVGKLGVAISEIVEDGTRDALVAAYK